MAKRKHKKGKSSRGAKKPKRPARLGPFGLGVEIDWSDHAAQRMRERLLIRGLTGIEVDQHFRVPITNKRDQVDPDDSSRYRRWSIHTTDTERVEIRYVYVVADDTPPGRVIMITVVAKKV